MGICVICKTLVHTDKMYCSEECLTELKSRQAIAEHKRRMERRLMRANQPQPKKMSMPEIMQAVVEDFARVLLDKDIPLHISSTEIDGVICGRDVWFRNMDTAYRRRCLSKNMGVVGYTAYAAAGRGNKTFKRVEDPDIIRERLTRIVS